MLKIHNHVIHEKPRGKMIWYPRWFFHIYRGPEYGERRILDGHVEFVLSKPTAEFGISFDVGTRGSETPFDGHVKIAGTTLYWGIEQGSQLADNITQRWLNRLPNRLAPECLDNTCHCPTWSPGSTSKRHLGRNGERNDERYEGRRFQIRVSDGKLWLHIWTFKNCGSRDFAGWRSRVLDLNPLDILFGEQRYWYDDVDQTRIVVQLPEGEYPVKAKLQKQRFGRPKLPRRHVETWTVDVNADECKGIPDHYDHSDGWKGDRVWGFGVPLKERRRDWHIDAKAAIESRILKSRADSGFREALPIGESL